MRMRLIGLIGVMLAVAWPVMGANHYVRTSPSGAANGSDWNNAWGWSTIPWGSVSAGDTLYLAGGNYGSLQPGKSGTSGNIISILRATTATCGSVAGWNAAWDDDAIVAANGINFDSYRYVTISGVTPGGILIHSSTGGKNWVADSQRSAICLSWNWGLNNPVNVYNTVAYAMVSASGTDQEFVESGGPNGAALIAGNVPSYCTLDHCIFSNICNGVYGENSHNNTVSHCEFTALKAYAYNGVGVHANVIYMGHVNYWTIRHNYVHDIAAGSGTLGICYEDNTYTATGTAIYGNLFVSDDPNQPSIGNAGYENQTTIGSIYIYNNTFVNARGIWFKVGPIANLCVSNNLFYNSGASYPGSATVRSGYNWSSGGAIDGDPNSISYGAEPFIDAAGGDYRIVGAAGALYPRNNGVNLGAAYNTDMNGNTRGADGTWDMGAYEYGAGSETNPAPSYSTYNLNWSGCGYPGLVETGTVRIVNGGAGTLNMTAALASVTPTNFVLSVTEFVAPTNGTNFQIVFYHSTPGTFTNSVIWSTNGTPHATTDVAAVTVALLGQSSPATNGYFTGGNGSGYPESSTTAGYLFQTWDGDTDFANSSRAYYWLNLTNGGNYRVRATHFAYDTGRNSIWINVGSEPTNGTFQIWDTPYTNLADVWLTNYANWRGTNAVSVHEEAQFNPMIWSNLLAGPNLLVVVAREHSCHLLEFGLVAEGAGDAARITNQPVSVFVAVGSNATFTVEATGTPPLSYQWYSDSLGAIAWATNASMTITNAQVSDQDPYWCVVTNAYGTDTSFAAGLTVGSAPLITASPYAQTNADGAAATFICFASGPAPLAYQWYFGSSPIVGEDQPIMKLVGITTNESGNYKCVVTNAYGSVTSAVAALTVAELPYILEGPTPTNYTVIISSNFIFSVTAGGYAPLSYQWRLNGTALDRGGTWSSYGPGPYKAWAGSAGSYTVVITNIAGAVTSGPAVLTVLVPPPVPRVLRVVY